MIRSRLGVKTLILSGLVLGLMAFVASGSAQAEVGAKWTYINPTTKVLSEFTKALEAEVSLALENSTASLLFTTGGGTKVNILCTAATFDEGGTLSAEGTILPGKIKFTGCKTILNEKAAGGCQTHTAGQPAGTILTNQGEGLLKLHELATKEKDSTVLLKPVAAAKETFVTIEMGEECSIGESVPVTGELVIWDCKGNTSFKTHAITHLVEEFPGLHLLKALGQSATISGSANATLKGAHLNYEWAGLAA
jgi:hypothetical protein